ncbi:MAG: class II aldolase/adducin family protein [Gammaproteobacteria bacterium]|nr:class II aldolase/adducin family protein [Gammaproteobacteria bacterium]MCI0590975.1 class II aldolase/adducin family protein [Gammaproteobacteria bacterium]
MTHLKLREEIIRITRAINERGLNEGTSGNVSARVDGGFLITPTGVRYDEMRPQDIVLMRTDGANPPGQLRPSSEWYFHRAILAARDDVGAVIHAHSPYATALACTGRGIPAFHYMVAVVGGDSIHCAPYATFGTVELSVNVVEALDGRRACLLANHGMVVIGVDLQGAFRLAEEVEYLAKQYCIALAIGGPILLDATEMQTVLEKFQDYGKQDL